MSEQQQLPVLRLSGALPAMGEEYEMCAESEVFKSKTSALAQRMETLLEEFTGFPCTASSSPETEERVYELLAKLRENAHTSSDAIKGLSSTTEKVKVTSSATALTENRAQDGEGARPQDFFLDKIDNSRNTLFNPGIKLTSKPHATRLGLEESVALQISPEIPANLAKHLSLDANGANGNGRGAIAYYRNPYEEEIQFALKNNTPKWLFDSETVMCPLRVREKRTRKRKPAPDTLDLIPLVYVDTEPQLLELAEHLALQQVFAVDVEHHSQHSFQGFSCLMQISSLECDYIIDVIKLRSVVGDALRAVFADPNIVKVFHGADSDVKWLQRDFALYIVQLFDTGQAARVLNYSSASLAFALDRHCRVTANKSLQLADWRQRPLTRELLIYAREDTHFLLGIFDAMRRELLKLENALEFVLERSADIATRTYEKFVFNRQTCHLDLATDECTDVELQILGAISDWRDARARELDESPEFILPNRGVKRLAKVAPSTVLELVRELDTVNPSPFVRSHVEELLNVILRRGVGATTTTTGSLPSKKPMVAPLAVVAPQPQPVAKKDEHCFYLGVNGEHTYVQLEPQTMPPLTSITSASSSPIRIELATSKLFAPAKPEFDMTRVHELASKLAEKEQEEMRTRMTSVEQLSGAADELLKDLPFSPSPPKFEEKPLPVQSVVQAYGQKVVPLMPKVNQAAAVAAASQEEEEETPARKIARFEFTEEKAIAAGVIRAKEEDPKKTTRKQSKFEKPKREELLPDVNNGQPKRKNPYMLKPARSTAKSTTFLPKT